MQDYKAVYYEESASLNFCCGVIEIGEFYTANPNMWGLKLSSFKCDGTAIATTVPEQVEAIAELKALGFKRVKTFLGVQKPQKEITLWILIPPQCQIKKINKTHPSPKTIDTPPQNMVG